MLFQVNFMITNVPGFRRQRQGGNDQQQENRQRARLDIQLYRDLAQVSGGQVIEVTKGQLLKATSIITESFSLVLTITLTGYYQSFVCLIINLQSYF